MTTQDATAILEALRCQRGGCVCHAAAGKGHGLTHCPAHDDPTPSLHVSDDGGKVLFRCQAGCEQPRVLEELRNLGLWMSSPNGAKPKREIWKTYDYVDAEGKLVCQTVRYRPKGFAQRRPNPDEPGSWIWNLGPIHQRLVLYRLRELLAADPGRTIFICEGEKDADRLASLGLLATTNPMGALKWYRQYTQVLKGRSVAILEDNDQAGNAHAAKVTGELVAAGCTVRVVRLPGLAEKGDVSDWLDAGHTREELERCVSETQPEKPKVGGPYRLQCEISDPPVWLEHWPRGVIRVLNDDLRSIDGTLRAFTAQLKCSPGWGAGMSRGQFEQHIFGLLTAMEDDPEHEVDVPEARKWHGRVRVLLVRLSGERARGHGRIEGDRFYFRFTDLVARNAEDVNSQKGLDRERMTRAQLQAGLERLGGVAGKGSEESWVPLDVLELNDEEITILRVETE